MPQIAKIERLSDMSDEPAPTPTGFDFNQPTIVALCYLVSAISGFPMLIGVVLAYVWQGAPERDWEKSHFRFHIRSFWIGIAWGLLFIIPTVLTLGLAAWFLYPALALWLIIRSLIALTKAQRREPIANVTTWLW
jgi:uncharacterized membrane protein